MGQLEDKVVVVTGASRGLGEAMARGFASEGAHLALAARTTHDLERVADLCRKDGARSVEALTTDVADERSVEALVTRVKDVHGGLDVFVANAAVATGSLSSKRYTDLPSYDLDVVEQLFGTNAIGTWLCMKWALPAMREGGSFITLGSETARSGRAGSGLLAVTKACVDALTGIAASEMTDRGVRVNCLVPGGMYDTHLFGPDKMPEFLKQLPTGYSEPETVVPAAVWLASDDSTGVTGAHLVAKEFNARPVAETKRLLADASGRGPS